MNYQINPFVQHAVGHGQALLGEANKAVTISQNLIPACDDILISLNSGNLQGAAATAQNVKNLASQLIQSTQHLNNAINERMDMAAYVLNRIQQHVSELTGALQSIKFGQAGYADVEQWWSVPFQQTLSPYIV